MLSERDAKDRYKNEPTIMLNAMLLEIPQLITPQTQRRVGFKISDTYLQPKRYILSKNKEC